MGNMQSNDTEISISEEKTKNKTAIERDKNKICKIAYENRLLDVTDPFFLLCFSKPNFCINIRS